MNGRSIPYPYRLKENMSKICSNNWVADQIQVKYVMFGGKPRGEYLDALKIGIVYKKSIITSMGAKFNLKYFTFKL